MRSIVNVCCKKEPWQGSFFDAFTGRHPNFLDKECSKLYEKYTKITVKQ